MCVFVCEKENEEERKRKYIHLPVCLHMHVHVRAYVSIFVFDCMRVYVRTCALLLFLTCACVDTCHSPSWLTLLILNRIRASCTRMVHVRIFRQ